jgi:hypothetical protein
MAVLATPVALRGYARDPRRGRRLNIVADMHTMLVEAALEYAGRSVPVFPVWGVAQGRCLCGATCESPGKHPIGQCVPEGFKNASTDASTIRRWWTSYPQANIATPTAWCTVLDVDIRKGGDDTLSALERLHGALPDTPQVLTGGGGTHYYFKPAAVPCSNGKVGEGLDIKASGGYVLLPPSTHVSGRTYGDDLIYQLFETPLAAMPAWLVGLANGAGSTNGHHVPFKLPETIREGARQEHLYRLGRSMRAAGCAEPEILEALRAVNKRCAPPLSDSEVRDTARHAATQSDRPDFRRGMRGEASGNGCQMQPPVVTAPVVVGPASAPAASAALTIPDQALMGVARDFARLHSDYLESPPAFFYFDYLTYFGNLIAEKVTLDSELHPEPRLYTVKLGPSADARKSTSQGKVDSFFQSLDPMFQPRVLQGIGSAEGLANELKECPRIILFYDELKAFVDKAKNEGSVALPMVNTLFERGEYDNSVKTGRVSVRGARPRGCLHDGYLRHDVRPEVSRDRIPESAVARLRPTDQAHPHAVDHSGEPSRAGAARDDGAASGDRHGVDG